MSIIIPSRQTKIIRQSTRSKILGDIVSSFGLDLQSNLGVIRLSPRLRTNTAGVSNQGRAVAFRTFDQRIFALCGTRIFKNSAYNLISPFVEDASVGAITAYNPLYSDIEMFNNTLVATSNTELWSKATDGSGTGAWTQRDTGGGVTGLSTDTLHKLLYFKRQNRIYYLDNNQYVYSFDTAWAQAVSGSYSIDLGFTSGLPYTMIADSNYIYIGTVNQSPAGVLDMTKGASILLWDGVSTTITTEYKVKAQGILAFRKDDRGIVYALDSNGSWLQQTASGFEEVDRLPLDRELLTNALSGTYNSFIHPNGITFSRNGTFLFNINNLIGDSGATIKENLASGIWEWSKETGFIHRQPFTLCDLGSVAVTDFGQNRVSAVGALYEPNIYSASSIGKPTLICGATYYTNASSTADGIFVDDPLDTIQKYGYFVTKFILSLNLRDTWKKIAFRYRKFLDSSDKIIYKYRVSEVSPTYVDITWVNTTSFTTTTNVAGLESYEVEVLQGTGSGKCAHITLISLNGGTYTVTVDETFTGVTTGTAKARLQAWNKISSIDDQTSESVITDILNDPASERIQLKVCMQFTGEDELYETILISGAHEKLE